MKQCSRCAKLGFGPKPESEFGVDKRVKSGLDACCKSCRRDKANAYRARTGYKPPHTNARVEKARARRIRWARANPHKVNEQSARWRAYKDQRTPVWADLKKIEEVYKDAKDRPHGPYHVDHIYPLRGRKVSGLHVHNNLQVLPGIENLRKGNRFQVEFQEEPRDLERAANTFPRAQHDTL